MPQESLFLILWLQKRWMSPIFYYFFWGIRINLYLSLFFSIVLSTCWSWGLRLIAKTPELSVSFCYWTWHGPQPGEGTSTRLNRQQPPVAHPYLLATVPSPERLLCFCCDRGTGDQEQQWQWPGSANTRSNSDHVLPSPRGGTKPSGCQRICNRHSQQGCAPSFLPSCFTTYKLRRQEAETWWSKKS